jgi:hypothetical protein
VALRNSQALHGPEPLLREPAGANRRSDNSNVRLRLAAWFSVIVYNRCRVEQCCGFKNQRVDIHLRVERMLRQPLRIERCAVVARADALLNRDAIWSVKRLTTSFVNLAVPASVQDASMHAPFAAEVEWNVTIGEKTSRSGACVPRARCCLS